jgi:hypothetical protein
MLTTREAKAQGIPRADVFRYTHWLYRTEQDRAFAAVRLNHEAVRALRDTITVGRRDEYLAAAQELSAWWERGGLATGQAFPRLSVVESFFDNSHYEYFKVAAALELHLKARLVARGFLAHYLDRNDPALTALAREQATRPVHIDEVLGCTEFYFDGNENFIPGLLLKSLGFSLLTQKPSYGEALGLPESTLRWIDGIRVRRNEIHFPSQAAVAISLTDLIAPELANIIPFANEHIIEWSNAKTAQFGFAYPQLSAFRA